MIITNSASTMNVIIMENHIPINTGLIISQAIESPEENIDLYDILQNMGLILLMDISKENCIAISNEYYSYIQCTEEYNHFFIHKRIKTIYTRLSLNQLTNYVQELFNAKARNETTCIEFLKEENNRHLIRRFGSAVRSFLNR